jgi:hypothetical protein
MLYYLPVFQMVETVVGVTSSGCYSCATVQAHRLTLLNVTRLKTEMGTNNQHIIHLWQRLFLDFWDGSLFVSVHLNKATRNITNE